MKPTTYDARLDDALAFVAERFRQKSRKCSPIPYLSHLLAVTALVMEHGGEADAMIAAALHDYLEDIPGASLAELEQRFGANVARLVDALSDSKDATQHKAPWRERKLGYLAHLRGAGHDVKLVSACDKLHNARSIVADQRRVGDDAFLRFNASKDETLWYYREVLSALHDGWQHDVIAELESAVSEMHSLARWRSNER